MSCYVNHEAQTVAIRHTVHHKPPSNMGSLRPFRGGSIILVCSYSYGGDCVTIEQYVLHSLCGMRCKDMTKFPFCTFLGGKSGQKNIFLKIWAIRC